MSINQTTTRRTFLQTALAASGVASLPAWAQNKAELREGYDYRLLKTPQPLDTGKKIEVVEFFWYGCPHCFHFEPLLAPWVKKLPNDVGFRRVHVAFRDDFVPHQRLYYTLEALGKLNQFHEKAFDAFHVEKRPMNNAEQIAEWAGSVGLDKKAFVDTYNSFAIMTKCTRAKQESENWKISGVPTIGIQGKYLTSASIIGAKEEKVIEVMDQLIAEIRKGKK
jgi:thiol:disulfide interchange protein DsbA